MVFCTSCGAQIADHLNFCPKCGAKNKYKKELGTPTIQDVPPEQTQESSSPTPVSQAQQMAPYPSEEEKPKQGIGAALDFARRGIEEGVKMAEKGIEAAKDEIEERLDKDEPAPSPQSPIEYTTQPVSSTAQPVPAPELPKKKFCPKCGYEIVGAGKFCSNCGNAVE